MKTWGKSSQVGEAVDRVQVGDRVVLPFNIGCGFCANCEHGLSAFCLTTADRSQFPNMAGDAYGFVEPCRGGQAKLLRVLYGDYNCLILPEASMRRFAGRFLATPPTPTRFRMCIRYDRRTLTRWDS
jgi:glutathione-independent formaldehyde dehydrogenase